MAQICPAGDSELWAYLRSSDGLHCPMYSSCRMRQQGGWCTDDNAQRLRQLLDHRRFSFRNYEFIQYGTPGKIFDLVEGLARTCLERAEVYSPPTPVDLVFMIDGPVEVRSLRLNSYHGAVWRLKDEWIIHLNKDDASPTKRFTLFHEVFHILSHQATGRTSRKTATKQGSFHETLADAFAHSILMPTEWVKEKWDRTNDLESMTAIFGVPKSAMCIRLKRMGLI